ncbi:putative 1-aminocyclopropane-1-carboxylate synthase [Diaporthe sp. PMI_573]|nr:putative 1-aminocyclopropane-1-carboxylate synthase [Diaporthaceae sp. PMI_573]
MTINESNLSHRGAFYASPENNNALLDILRDTWDPVSNPNGFLSLGVAENTLMHKELISHIESTLKLDSHALGYGDGFDGSHRLRQILSDFLTSWFKPSRPVLPQEVVVTSGVSAAIEACAFSLCDPGDGVLLARPFYRAFLYNLRNRAGLRPVLVSFNGTDPMAAESIKAYERALLEAKQEGITIKALMLCNPHNPLGRCACPQLLHELMRFCQKYKIHLISDEIYGLSCWGNTELPDTSPFHSVLAIDKTNLIDPALVHVLWGMSKDFGVNGMRLGCVVSQSNDDLLRALRANSIFTCPSSLADRATVSILSNAAFVKNFIKKDQQRLAEHYDRITRFLSHHKICFAPSNSGFFIWADLFSFWSPRLGSTVANIGHSDGESSEKWTLEDRLSEHFYKQKIFLAAGKSFGSEDAGWFRLTFALEQDYLDEGLRRVVTALETFYAGS